MKMYELTNEYSRILDMLYDDEIEQEAVINTLDTIEELIEDKADNYAKIITELTAEKENCEKEEKRFKARKDRADKNIKMLKERLKENLEVIGKTKFKTDLFSFSVCNNGGLQPMEVLDTETIPEEYQKISVSVDNDKLREKLDKGIKLVYINNEIKEMSAEEFNNYIQENKNVEEYAFLKARGTNLRIK